MSDDPEDFTRLLAMRFKSATTIEERRAREVRPMSRRSRTAKGRTKTEQMNLKVTPAFKKRVAGMAYDRGVSIVELIELAIEQMQGASNAHNG